MKKENKKNNDKTNECVQNSTNINCLPCIYGVHHLFLVK